MDIQSGEKVEHKAKGTFSKLGVILTLNIYAVLSMF